jgi:hypothetical protein
MGIKYFRTIFYWPQYQDKIKNEVDWNRNGITFVVIYFKEMGIKIEKDYLKKTFWFDVIQ